MNDAGSPTRFGVYVHWPYCRNICPYCDFNVYRDRHAEAEALVAAICADLAGWRGQLGPRTAQTVFFGGGTPSRLAPEAVARILAAVDDAFGLTRDAEVSLEANPEDVTPAMIADLARAGVTRISLGVQALDDAALAALGRWHSAEDGVRAVDAALAHMSSVSLDLIYAREGQTLQAWDHELRTALALGAHHISAYQLTVEPGTAFAKREARGDLVVPDGDASADFYALTQAVCAEAGYVGYEISNHARSDGHRSQHNRLYWECADWAGVGPGAHGRFGRGGGRWASEAARRPEAYARRVEETGWGVVSEARLGEAARGQEYVLMGLRLAEGISLARFERETLAPIDPRVLAGLVSDGLVGAAGDRVWVEPHARALTERIARELAPG